MNLFKFLVNCGADDLNLAQTPHKEVVLTLWYLSKPWIISFDA
jgi:hypothetical protein